MKCHLLLIIVGIVYSHQRTTSSSANQNTDRNLFAADIYQAIASEKTGDNVVISPAAIQTSMALAYSGAKGKTAQEMQSGFRFGSANSEQVVQNFGDFQKSFTRNNNVRLFNNIYINENLEFKSQFKETAQRNFDSNVEKADFHPPYNRRTADRINKAVESKTNSKISDVIDPQLLNDRTEAVIVNAITYSAPWQKAFKADKTSKRSFSAGNRQNFQVDTMWTLNNFKYGEFGNLDCKVIELPFQNDEFSMLILLPNNKNGLQNLIRSLAGKDLVALTESGLSSQKVEVYLPKFSVTFGVNLEEPFKKLGVNTMFTREGDFGNLFRMFVSHFISSAAHKAQFEVTEAGTEQPLEGGGGILGIFSRTKKFEVDHPFVFAIKHGDSIIFMGHIATYAYV